MKAEARQAAIEAAKVALFQKHGLDHTLTLLELGTVVDVIAPLIARVALERAAGVARNGCLVPPDGGSPTEAEADMCDHIADAILALPDE